MKHIMNDLRRELRHEPRDDERIAQLAIELMIVKKRDERIMPRFSDYTALIKHAAAVARGDLLALYDWHFSADQVLVYSELSEALLGYHEAGREYDGGDRIAVQLIDALHLREDLELLSTEFHKFIKVDDRCRQVRAAISAIDTEIRNWRLPDGVRDEIAVYCEKRGYDAQSHWYYFLPPLTPSEWGEFGEFDYERLVLAMNGQ